MRLLGNAFLRMAIVRSQVIRAFLSHTGPKWTGSVSQSQSFCSSSSSEGKIISIDRSGLFRLSNDPSHDPQASQAAEKNKKDKSSESDLVRHIKSIIRFRGGPITLGEYMSEVLTNPTAGYYTQRDVFGTAGDFVTSPEISQMFGEMIGIWAVAQWQAMGRPKRLNLVELGPGRGTLMADMLRGTRVFREFSAALSINLVEVSPVLRRIQMKNLGVTPIDDNDDYGNLRMENKMEYEVRSDCPGASRGSGGNGDECQEAVTASGVPVMWHRSIDSIDYLNEPVLYLAHEFFDALPVHQFQLTSRGWCERLVDEQPVDAVVDFSSHTTAPHFRMVLSPGPTPSVRTMLQWRLQSMSVQERAKLKGIEISPQAVALAEMLAEKIGYHGGAALIIDYGKDGPYTDSLMAIKDHKQCDLFDTPGLADLSAWVDFEAIRLAVNKSPRGATTYGPISQSQFLHGLGITERLKRLLENASPEQTDALIAGYHRLVGDHNHDEAHASDGPGMGESYKVLCIANSRQSPPLPFQ